MLKIDEKELKELFIELKCGNKKAFENLYTKYNRLVYGIAFSILKNKTDSEDIVQTVFSKIYEINKEKLPTNKEASWIYTLTKNETITFLRKRENYISLENIYEIEDNDNEINNIIDRDSYNRLISKLNNKEKQIISLKILGNFSFKEISKVLNEPSGTVKWRYYKAVNTIKMLLSNLGMFIVTFIIGLKTLFNKNKMNRVEEQATDNKTENETLDRTEEKIEEDTSKSETSDFQDKYKEESKSQIMEEENNKQESIVINETENNTINYYGIGFLSISAIFLIITIICATFFIKYQLKSKKKTSK